jgi:MoaA/NifB/PqqE/SkfB family radical SAM enzyme
MALTPFKKKHLARLRLGSRYAGRYLLDDLFHAHTHHSPVGKPLDVLCELTYNCNLRCPTCFRWTSGPDKNELGLEDWKGVIADLKKWIGTFNLSFSGGEPFLREDALDIFRFASESGIFVSAISNGSMIDPALARKIVLSGLDALSLSLNSLNPEVHNATRGVTSSFGDVMKAIRNLKARGEMSLTISTTVMKENVKDLIDLVEFVKAEGLDGINFQPLMEASALPVYDQEGQSRKGPKGRLYEELGKDTGDIQRVFGRLIEMKQQGAPINNSIKHLRSSAVYLSNPDDPSVLRAPCKIGPKNFFIDPYGNVRICNLMGPVGNITQERPEKLWRSAEAQRQREMILNCRMTCRLLNCNFKELDLGSRVRRHSTGKRP